MALLRPLRWAYFSWDLTKGAPESPALPVGITIRYATPQERDAVHAVVVGTFTLNSEWNPFFKEIRPKVEAALEEIFHEKEEPLCLVISNGPRIIGASPLCADPEAPNHLQGGPCLSMEYHNRGLGTALLAHSLIALHKAEVTLVHGMTKVGSTADQFIYPKFGSKRFESQR